MPVLEDQTCRSRDGCHSIDNFINLPCTWQFIIFLRIRASLRGRRLEGRKRRWNERARRRNERAKRFGRSLFLRARSLYPFSIPFWRMPRRLNSCFNTIAWRTQKQRTQKVRKYFFSHIRLRRPLSLSRDISIICSQRQKTKKFYFYKKGSAWLWHEASFFVTCNATMTNEKRCKFRWTCYTQQFVSQRYEK